MTDTDSHLLRMVVENPADAAQQALSAALCRHFRRQAFPDLTQEETT